MDACRRRFGSDAEVSFHLNQADSLEIIADNSIDFIFSFDSMVHVRPQTIETYLRQFPAKLKPNGLAFIHHSNLGEFASSLSRRARVLAGKGTAPGADHQRDPEMTAALFRESCERHGLKVVCQELVNWRGRRLIDCFSTIARNASKWKAIVTPFQNREFMLEAEFIRRRSQHYPQGPVQESSAEDLD